MVNILLYFVTSSFLLSQIYLRTPLSCLKCTTPSLTPSYNKGSKIVSCVVFTAEGTAPCEVVWPVPVAAQLKAWVCGRSLTEIPGSNPAGGMDVCLL